MKNLPHILFLDDEPSRAAAFLKEHPQAVWVQTVEECLSRLEEPWDEIHLDHDLGGETYVDHEREDCGMEVVRWICREPRPHLRAARFFVHTHNVNAACVMALHLQIMGFKVSVRPFGQTGGAHPSDTPPEPWPLLGRVVGWLRGRRAP